MNQREVKLKDLPAHLRENIANELEDYTVTVYQGIKLLGTGTLIQCAGRKGILTAHHVVHRCSPPLDFSPNSSQKVLLGIRKQRHTFQVPASYLNEIVIGVPVSDKQGPDLTFIEILRSESLSWLEAIKSFWNLDHNTENRLRHALSDSGVWVKMGAPKEFESITQENEKVVRIDVPINAFFCVATSDRRFSIGGFDFVDTKVDYRESVDLPNSYGGVSGGGLWKIELVETNSTWDWCPLFCGVAFYETAKKNGVRTVRCHYAQSIYKNTRAALSNTHQ